MSVGTEITYTEKPVIYRDVKASNIHGLRLNTAVILNEKPNEEAKLPLTETKSLTPTS